MTEQTLLPKVLLIDDDVSLCLAYTVLLEDDFEITTALTGAAGVAHVQREDVDVVLLDLRLPDMPGLEVLQQLTAVIPTTPILIITAVDTATTAVTALRQGAVDYLVKPVDNGLLLHRLHELVAAQVSPAPSKTPVVRPWRLLGHSRPMRQLATLIWRLAALDTTVLIMGETGVGKEGVARTIHAQSPRRHGPFVVVDGAALPDSLVNSILFGHERGAFTDAARQHLGKIEQAYQGTLFLDQVESLGPTAQGALLRFLQERTFERIGSEVLQHADVRIVAATTQDLQALVTAGAFRADLFYRLHVVPVLVPPLRERRADIPLLLRYFLEKYSAQYRRPVPQVTPAAFQVLQTYLWPGNVRELEHVSARLVATSAQVILDSAAMETALQP